jgi:predicted chitinase
MNADRASAAIANSLKELKLDPKRFTKLSLFHFLAQITSESIYGSKLIQVNAPSEAARGYGYCQVTGRANITKAAACMNKASPGSGIGVVSNPAGTIGRDPGKAALASLCWWKINIVENDQNDRYCKCSGPECVRSLTQIGNSGHVGGPIYHESASLPRRQRNFKALMNLDRAGTCRGGAAQ